MPEYVLSLDRDDLIYVLDGIVELTDGIRYDVDRKQGHRLAEMISELLDIANPLD